MLLFYLYVRLSFLPIKKGKGKRTFMGTEKIEIELNKVPWGERFWHENREYVITGLTGSHKDTLLCFNVTNQDAMLIDTSTMVTIDQSICPISVEKITEDICNIMKKHSPDGRIAGAEFITDYIIRILNQLQPKEKGK